MDNFDENQGEIDIHVVIEGYKALITKFEENSDMYKKIIDEQKKTISLLKEQVEILKELNALKDERIDSLIKALKGE